MKDKVDFTDRTAQNFMKVAKEFSNTKAIADLNITKVYALLDLPQEEREPFIKENPVNEMTTRELQQAIKNNNELTRQLETERSKPPIIKTEMKSLNGL